MWCGFCDCGLGGGAGVGADCLSHKRSWNSIPSWREWWQKVLKHNPIQGGVVIKEDNERSWNCPDLANCIEPYPCALLNVQFQKISVLPPTEGIGISWGVGVSVRPKNLKKCMKLNWNFQRGGGGGFEKIPLGGRYGYFLELHNTCR